MITILSELGFLRTLNIESAFIFHKFPISASQEILITEVLGNIVIQNQYTGFYPKEFFSRNFSLPNS